MLDEDSSITKKTRPVVLLFLDGLGIDVFSEVNAISEAKPKFFYSLARDYPVALFRNESLCRRKRYRALGTGQKTDKLASSKTCLAKILADNNLRHLKITSAYNYTLVNYLFNNLNSEAFSLEERIMTGYNRIDVFSDAKEIVKKTQEAVVSDNYDFITISLPILDQLSSNYDFKATVKGMKYLDDYLKKISQTVLDNEAILIITSAYGNAEYTKDLAADREDKEITKNPVPFLLVAEEYMGKTIGLADPLDDDLSLLSPIGNLDVLLPTILSILDIKDDNISADKSLI